MFPEQSGGVCPARQVRQNVSPQVIGVDDLSAKIREIVSSAPDLKNLAVRGELQNLKKHTSGHVYFTLVGQETRVAVVLFRSNAASVVSWPRDGDEVLVTGYVDVYAKTGSYQIYANRLLPIGIGAKERAKEELRAALEREGIFDLRHKRPIPRYPERVAVVTSPTGAAIQDILKVSIARAPFVDVIVIPALVQGVDAPPQVAHALGLASQVQGLSCVILARGGGARDDLSPFDDERIVRAIRSCPFPVVTGLGHEIDNTLADLAADAALPTPSAAAERVFPDSSKIVQALERAGDSFSVGMSRLIERCENNLDKRRDRLLHMIDDRLYEEEDRLSGFSEDLARDVGTMIERGEAALATIAARLDALSPLAVLARGYVICRDSAGHVVHDAGSLACGEEIGIQFRDGAASAKIEAVELTAPSAS